MKDIKDTILQVYDNVIKEKEVTQNNAISQKGVGRESGLDSLSFVSLIVGIEEKLDINLDSVLIELRNTKTLSAVIDIVDGYIKTKKSY